MDVLTNSTKFNEVEHDMLESIQYAVWIIAGLAICAIICCVWSFFDRITSAIGCLCKTLTCCCRSNGHKRLKSDEF